ncbi:MAG TPA: M1 family aminopeptidase [Thermoplasmata archaeon]|nr:M1 family aminopeptidase [Thermoplasmata archaeon]
MPDSFESCRGHGSGTWDKAFASPDAPEHPPRDRTFLLHHVRLDIDVDDVAGTVSGTATHRLSPINDGLRSVTFDAGDLTIKRVLDSEGKALEWDHVGEVFTVRLARPKKAGEVFELRVRYAAKPRVGLYFKAPDKAYPKRARIAWTQGEDMDNRYWFPSYDYPNQRFTSEVVATVDDRYEALSNGRLVRVAHDKGRKRKTFHWSLDKPHSNYLIALAVGRFDSKEWTVDGLPVQAHVPKGLGGYLDRAFGNVPDMVRYFGRATGLKYPWPRYDQVCVPEFIAGGMENSSMTLLYEYCLADPPAYPDYQPESLLAHELAHQWFGDWITTKSWGHIWLNESFATYFDILWWEHFLGKDEALVRLQEDRVAYLEEAAETYKRPIVTHRFLESSDMFDRHTYEKGGNVLHMMRFVLGDDLWWKGIRHYVTKHSGQNVETNDLKIAIEEATGRNLDGFFDQWLYKAGHPEFEVSWSYDEKAKQVALKVKQTQEVKDLVPLFKTPVDLEVFGEGRSWRERVHVEKAEQVFFLESPKRPKGVVFDPDDVILKSLTFKKEKDELLWLLAHAKGVGPRIAACKGLARFLAAEDAVEGLRKVLTKDRFWAVRREAAAALGEIGSAGARDTLLEGVRDKDSRVRRGVYRALGKFRNDDVALKALETAYAQDGSHYPMQTAALALAETRHPKAFDAIVKGMDRTSHVEIVARGACMALANLRDERGIERLKERTAYGRHELVRYTAAWALGKLGSFHEDRRDEVMDHLTGMLRDPNYRARLGAAIGLGELRYKKAVPELEKAADGELVGHLRTYLRASIRSIRELHAEGAKRLEQQEELDKLKDENKDLQRRVQGLESKVEGLAKRRR